MNFISLTFGVGPDSHSSLCMAVRIADCAGYRALPSRYQTHSHISHTLFTNESLAAESWLCKPWIWCRM